MTTTPPQIDPGLLEQATDIFAKKTGCARWNCGSEYGCGCRDSARAILSLASTAHAEELASRDAEIERLREALEPFANEAKFYEPSEQDGKIIIYDLAFSNDGDDLNVGHLRRARAALAAKGGSANA